MAASKEGKVEAYFVQRVEALGGLTRKAKWLCRRGCPDRFWAFHGKCGLVEIKPPDRPQLDAHQAREAARLRQHKVNLYALDSFEAVDAFIAKEFT